MMSRRLTASPCFQALVIFAAVFAAASCISLHIFKAYPFGRDEYSYVYQAKIFAQGKLYLKADDAFQPYSEVEMQLHDGRLHSKYPPGNSAILALGMLAGYPALISPLLGALSAVILWLTMRSIAVSRPVAFGTTLLLGTNPYYLEYSSSYFSQVPALFFTAIGFWAIAQGGRREQVRSWIGGCAVACCALVRQLDAFCLMCSILVSIAKDRKATWFRSSATVLILGAIGALALCTTHYFIGGVFKIAMPPVWDFDFKVNYTGSHNWHETALSLANDYVANAWLYARPLFIDYFCGWTGPALLIGAGIGFRLRLDRLGLACATFIIGMIALYNDHGTLGYPEYGARYWYPILVPLTLMAARGFDFVFQDHSKRTWACVAVFLFGWQAALAYDSLTYFAGRSDAEMRIQQDILNVCPPNSIVVMDRYPDFKRNPLLDDKGLRFPHDYGQRKFIIDHQEHMPPDVPGTVWCHYPPPGK